MHNTFSRSDVNFSCSTGLDRVRRTSKRPAGTVPSGDAVDLSMGEPDFSAPVAVVDAMRSAVQDGYSHYGDLNGDPELRKEIARQSTLRSNQKVVPAQVSIGHGATGVLASLVLALVSPGDRVVIPEPTYSLYSDLVEMVGGQVIWVPLQSDLQLDVPAILSAARGAKLLILCNPGNPTGAVFPQEDLRAIGKGLQGSETVVVSDEAYSAFTYGADLTSAISVPELTERVVVVDTLSKSFALTGFRLGWSIAPPAIAAAISQVSRMIAGAPNAAVQRAAIVALRQGHSLYSNMQDEYSRRREFVVTHLSKVQGVSFEAPQGAFYAFFKHGVGATSDEVRLHLANAGVLLRSGSEYGASGEGYLRMSFAASLGEIAKGIDRIALGLGQMGVDDRPHSI
ncbi:pyridoxal phosphate-dependent aminotransferase [Brevibacterium permense]|uniref:pyridoxal phosphate-dependent aminotransferase n=1 Tax=Brevibacterium permense TaxID=234834 RepID=UPI0021D2EB29|nr:pyridoxal phosphate-dependent aminotransferase [Brevibacterium permense]MCU4299126.1 pyridoxal phosphate-dependent aminotransferase [Brevibacterium permense]